MPIPTRRLVLVVAAASLLLLVVPLPFPFGLLVVNSGLALLAVLDFLRTLDPHAVIVERALPQVVRVGCAADVQWRWINPSRRALRLEFADDLPPSLRLTNRRQSVAVMPFAETTSRSTIIPQRRGRFAVRNLAVRTHGPWGLMARQRTRALPGEIRVYPPFPGRAEAELRLQRRLLDTGQRSLRERGNGSELDALRPYEPDDEVRNIDWAATARSAIPIVRTHRAERNQPILVLLDCGRTMAAQCAGVPRLNLAMDAALAVAAAALRLGDRVGLRAFDAISRATLAISGGPAQMARMAAAVFDLQPALMETDYVGAFTQATAQLSRRTLIVILSELTDEGLTQGLLPALPSLTRHHLVIVGAAVDPQLLAWAQGPVQRSSEAYRSAAAAHALTVREHSRAKLAGRGAVVVDAPPATLARGVVDAYLDIKKMGCL